MKQKAVCSVHSEVESRGFSGWLGRCVATVSRTPVFQRSSSRSRPRSQFSSAPCKYRIRSLAAGALTKTAPHRFFFLAPSTSPFRGTYTTPGPAAEMAAARAFMFGMMRVESSGSSSPSERSPSSSSSSLAAFELRVDLRPRAACSWARFAWAAASGLEEAGCATALPFAVGRAGVGSEASDSVHF